MNKLTPQSSQLTKKGNTDLKRPPFVKQKEDAGLLETKNEVWPVNWCTFLHQRAKTSCVINIPYGILKNKNLNSLIVHLDITPAETSALLKVLIAECGGDPSQVILSYSPARKFHEQKVHQLLRTSNLNMIFNYPLGLHWDGKIMADNEDKITKIERLPVLVSDSEGTENYLGFQNYK